MLNQGVCRRQEGQPYSFLPCYVLRPFQGLPQPLNSGTGLIGQVSKPLTIRFDMPLVLSAIPAGETEHVAFRYVVGIGRSF